MPLAHPVSVRRIAALPEAFPELAADATADGVRLLEVLREDWEGGTMRFDTPGEALFVAMAGPALLGLGGVTRDPFPRGDGAGRVRRVYVRRAARRHGVGRALVAAIAEAARAAGWQRLRVRAPVDAFAFYECCGFVRTVGETAATHMLPLVPPPLIPAPPGTP